MRNAKVAKTKLCPTRYIFFLDSFSIASASVPLTHHVYSLKNRQYSWCVFFCRLYYSNCCSKFHAGVQLIQKKKGFFFKREGRQQKESDASQAIACFS